MTRFDPGKRSGHLKLVFYSDARAKLNRKKRGGQLSQGLAQLHRTPATSSYCGNTEMNSESQHIVPVLAKPHVEVPKQTLVETLFRKAPEMTISVTQGPMPSRASPTIPSTAPEKDPSYTWTPMGPRTGPPKPPPIRPGVSRLEAVVIPLRPCTAKKARRLDQIESSRRLLERREDSGISIVLEEVIEAMPASTPARDESENTIPCESQVQPPVDSKHSSEPSSTSTTATRDQQQVTIAAAHKRGRPRDIVVAVVIPPRKRPDIKDSIDNALSSQATAGSFLEVETVDWAETTTSVDTAAATAAQQQCLSQSAQRLINNNMQIIDASRSTPTLIPSQKTIPNLLTINNVGAEQEQTEQDPPKAKRGRGRPPKSERDPPKAEIDPPKAEIDPPKAEIDPPKIEIDPPEARRGRLRPPKSERDPPKAEGDPPKAKRGRPPKSDSGPQKAKLGRPPKSDSGPQKARLGRPPKSVSGPQKAKLSRPPKSVSGPQKSKLGRPPKSDSGPQKAKRGRPPKSVSGPQKAKRGRPPKSDSGPQKAKRGRPPKSDSEPPKAKRGRPPRSDSDTPNAKRRRVSKSSAMLVDAEAEKKAEEQYEARIKKRGVRIWKPIDIGIPDRVVNTWADSLGVPLYAEPRIIPAPFKLSDADQAIGILFVTLIDVKRLEPVGDKESMEIYFIPQRLAGAGHAVDSCFTLSLMNLVLNNPSVLARCPASIKSLSKDVFETDHAVEAWRLFDESAVGNMLHALHEEVHILGEWDEREAEPEFDKTPYSVRLKEQQAREMEEDEKEREEDKGQQGKIEKGNKGKEKEGSRSWKKRTEVEQEPGAAHITVFLPRNGSVWEIDSMMSEPRKIATIGDRPWQEEVASYLQSLRGEIEAVPGGDIATCAIPIFQK